MNYKLHANAEKADNQTGVHTGIFPARALFLYNFSESGTKIAVRRGKSPHEGHFT
jgi:hypothetical protein